MAVRVGYGIGDVGSLAIAGAFSALLHAEAQVIAGNIAGRRRRDAVGDHRLGDRSRAIIFLAVELKNERAAGDAPLQQQVAFGVVYELQVRMRAVDGSIKTGTVIADHILVVDALGNRQSGVKRQAKERGGNLAEAAPELLYACVALDNILFH